LPSIGEALGLIPNTIKKKRRRRRRRNAIVKHLAQLLEHGKHSIKVNKKNHKESFQVNSRDDHIYIP
jgi:hypothetical protein